MREDFTLHPGVFPPECALGGGDGERALVAQSSWSRAQKGKWKAVIWWRGTQGERPTVPLVGIGQVPLHLGHQQSLKRKLLTAVPPECGSRELQRDGSSGCSRVIEGALLEKWEWPGLALGSDPLISNTGPAGTSGCHSLALMRLEWWFDSFCWRAS